MFTLKKDTVCPIGKYREMTFKEISELDPSYLGWFRVNITKLPNLGCDFTYDVWFNQFKTMYLKDQYEHEQWKKRERIHNSRSRLYSFKTAWGEDLLGGYDMPDYF